MQWFFFKNGMFFKKTSLNLRLKQDISRLLKPFAFFSFIGLIIYWIDLIIAQNNNLDYYTYFIRQIFSSGFITANSPLWFLFSLFLVRLVYTSLHEKVNDYLILITSFLIAFICYKYSITIPKYLANSAIGMVFFICGKKMRILQYNRIIFLVAIFIYLLISIFNPSRIAVIGNNLLSGSYILAYPYALSAIIIIDAIAKRIPNVIYETSISRYILYIGRESMFFFVLHWIFITLCYCIVVHIFSYPQYGLEFLTVLLITCFIILPLILFNIQKKSNAIELLRNLGI